jgi:hypothetical protein
MREKGEQTGSHFLSHQSNPQSLLGTNVNKLKLAHAFPIDHPILNHA